MTSYKELLESKIKHVTDAGFDVAAHQLNAYLFPFQAHIVQKALKRGRYAVFADCGLGKTLMQLSWADEVVRHTGRPVIILTPLAVAGQTMQEAEKFGVTGVVRWMPEMGQNSYTPDLIYVAHYEQLDSLNTDDFAGVVLDESSILKNFEGATRNALMQAFRDTPYKLCCTATPSPNDPMELGNHAEFLTDMSRVQMLAMYFVHDGGETNKWRLKGHAERKFWQWVASWSIMLARPQDIGFDMIGYDLPDLNLIERHITTQSREESGKLFNDIAVNATNFNQELRLTKLKRITHAADIVNASNEPFIIWIKQNEEADELLSLIPDAVEVRGDMSPELKEKRLLGFADGKFRVLITKTKIAQFGLNYQHCHNQVFAALDFSFEGVYQGIRRSYRFGQQQSVNVYLIATDTMQNVIASIRQKQHQFDNMRENMRIANGYQAEAKKTYTTQPIKLPYWLYGYAC